MTFENNINWHLCKNLETNDM